MRRRWQLVLGAAALAFFAGVPALRGAGHDTPGASHGTEVMLLNCMDYRLVDQTAQYMAKRGFKGKYDDIVLAGAALGAVTEKHPAWNETFWDELGVALDLHHIHKVMVLDHRDCGAYKVILGEDFAKDPANETAVHTAQLKRLGEAIHAKYPALEVELLLMALDGKVETIQ
jgi:carbonic anhydrase